MEENLKQPGAVAGILRIAVFGPESTGKTTLASALANAFNTTWAPEFAREYLQKKYDDSARPCAPEDLMPIALGQITLEAKAMEGARNFVFCDTCLLQTKVYADHYFGICDASIAKAAKKHKYDLFLLTDIDVPWTPDDLRDRPQNRSGMLADFRAALEAHDKPYILVSGTPEQRLERSMEILEGLRTALGMGFTSHDFVQLHARGTSLDAVASHFSFFANGIPKTMLERPATIGDGILKFDAQGYQFYADLYDRHSVELDIAKFVPASGAASRMFKFLSEYLNDTDAENESVNAYINRKKAAELAVFLAGLEKFPFFDQVLAKLNDRHGDFGSWDRSRKIYHFVSVLLNPGELAYCDKPKGVLPFHKYRNHIATPVEEHLAEAASYAVGKNRLARLHFTVSEGHRPLFEAIVSNIKQKYEQEAGAALSIGYSQQDPATDTLGVDPGNHPFRDQKGKLVFRPGGHGALIRNLGNLDSDIVFIKNIDNVTQGHSVEIALYKKALAGLLLELRDGVFNCLELLERDSDAAVVDQIHEFICEKLQLCMPDDFDMYTTPNKIALLKKMLARPIRVCGMVKNEGEPGGGPFWVRDRKGNVSLQIVESAQVDLASPAQSSIMAGSTHFNPVDIVCSFRDRNGGKYDLENFVDHESGFIVEKNKDGKPLKAFELPGLWNGAMAKWITVFVEVPLITFNPVKTVNDLLKSAHQP